MHHLNPAHATWHASRLYHATGALEDAQWIVEKYQAKEEEDAAAVLAGRSADNTAATDGPARSYGDEEGPSATRSNPWSDPRFEDSISITHGQNHCTVCAGRPIGVELGLARCLDRQALLPDGSVLLPHQDAW